MKTANTAGSGRPELPLVGREKEIAQLKQLYAQGRHALIIGSAGVGKSALIRQLATEVPLLICPQSARLTEIYTALEQQLGLEAADLKLVQRKNRLLAELARAQPTVVFDGVGWMTPRLSSFLECVCQRAPVWIATRSEHPWDIGHFWPLLTRFERVELRPFSSRETAALVGAAIKRGLIPPETARIVEWLHRRSAGRPLVLHELLRELATGRYDLSNPLGLRRLDLDRRIHEVLPAAGRLAIVQERLRGT
jgi:hypothetical protein